MEKKASGEKWLLLTWDFKRKAYGRSSFYKRLTEIFSQLPSGSWRRVGGSVYLLKGRHAAEVKGLLTQAENSGLKWREFRVVD
ncbi:MAG: hypothetical protein QXT22_05575 [Candidatus Hadarchaeales archaeon]